MAIGIAVAVCSCGPNLSTEEDPCGLGAERPELPRGSARYVRDGRAVSTTGGGYKLEFPNDLVVGMMTINIKQDGDRRLVSDLVDTSSYPICVPLDGQEDGSGYVLIEDGAISYSTNDTRTGTVAILAKVGDALIGRFAFEAEENSGSGVTRVEDGIFNLLPR